ncbi:DUF1992 domain-containing protein [Desulfothermus okinawensis JCM 13304]
MDNYFAVLEMIAEKKIKEAMENGEFDSLEGKGKPIRLDDDSHIPPEYRLAYRILKNAGYIHPEIEQRKEVENICSMLEECEDEQEVYRKVQKLNLIVSKINLQRKTPVYLELDQIYYKKVVERIKVKKRKNRG